VFQKIIDDLINVSKTLNAKEMIEASPIYLVPQQSTNDETLPSALDRFMIQLDENGIISEKDSVCIRLFAEQGSANNVNSVCLGLYNDTGIFKKSLEDWINDIGLRYHLNHGIVLITLKQIKDIIADDIWYEQLFRHIKRFKNRFMFFISFEESELEDTANWIGKSFFYETIAAEKTTTEEHLKYILHLFEQYKIRIDEDAKKKLETILKDHQTVIDNTVVVLWQQTIIWNMLKRTDSNTILNQEYLSEDLLDDIIKRRKEEKPGIKIGF